MFSFETLSRSDLLNFLLHKVDWFRFHSVSSIIFFFYMWSLYLWTVCFMLIKNFFSTFLPRLLNILIKVTIWTSRVALWVEEIKLGSSYANIWNIIFCLFIKKPIFFVFLFSLFWRENLLVLTIRSILS